MGNNVIIGANIVVTKDISDICIFTGMPTKVSRVIKVDIYDLPENIC